MSGSSRPALLGGVAGAILALAVVLGAARLGLFAPSDEQLHRYMVEHPTLLVEMQDKLIALATANEEKPIQDAVDKLGVARILDPKLAYVAGPANAKKSFVEFFDYNCPHCRNSVALVHKFFDKHKNDTRFGFVEYPIFGGASVNAARAALASRLQPGKYPAFHFALMSGGNVTGPGEIVDAANRAGLDVDRLTKDLKAPNIDPELVAVQRLADRLKLRGTPVFIVNGKVHSGEIDEAELERLWKS